jgi:L-rhamnose mutarotase
MKRVAFILKVKQDKLEEYKEYHRKTWPDQLAALSRNGWHNYTLFIRPDGMLFGYVETTNGLQPALDGMATEPANIKWQEIMKPFFEILQGARPDQSMIELEEIFHLD